MKLQCHFCEQWFSSYDGMRTHELESHNLFKDSDINITEATIAKLRTTMARTKWLLENFPQTKGDDRIMFLMYMRIFEKHLVYNDNTHKIEFRDKEGVSYETWRNMTSWETIRRSRQKCQELYPSLKPSELTVLKREKREEAIRDNIKTMTISRDEYDKL